MKKFFCIYILLSMLVYACKKPDLPLQNTQQIATQQVVIEVAKDTIFSNDLFSLRIKGLDPNQKTYFLYQHSLGTILDVFDSGKSEISTTLDSTYMSRRGDILLQIFQQDQLLATKKIHILPKEAFGSIENYVGPRSVIVASNQDVMTIAIPTDEFDNPVAEQTTVDFQFLRPNGTLSKNTEKVAHLITYKSIFPQQKTGKTLMGINCGMANSKEKEWNEEAGWATSIFLDKIDYQSIADGRQFFSVKTLPIHDASNNLVVNGTSVVFYIRDTYNRMSRYTSHTSSGIAEVQIQNPSESGKLSIFAVCDGLSSTESFLYFSPRVKSFNVEYDSASKRMTVGPITAQLNQFIADGTPVSFEFYQGTNLVQTANAVAISGKATLDLVQTFLPKGEIDVVIRCIEAKSSYQLQN